MSRKKTHSLPWRVADAPEAYTQRLLEGIVGVEITITKIDATWKTSQNKSAQDQQSVMSALESVGSDRAKEMAVAIKANGRPNLKFYPTGTKRPSTYFDDQTLTTTHYDLPCNN